MNGGDIIGEVLQAHGVRFLFTLCGGHISPILKGAKDRGIRVVDTRHEVTAVFAADATARLTGTLYALSNKASAFTVGVQMALFALVPGLPFVPFIVGAAALGFAAWFVRRQDQRREAEAARKAGDSASRARSLSRAAPMNRFQ